MDSAAVTMDNLEQIRTRLTEHKSVVFAFLFGSRAMGNPRPDSDWDVAVFLDPALSSRERFRHRLRLSAELEEFGPVDVVVLNDAPPLLAHRALQGRKLLSCDDKQYIRFFVHTLAQSGDESYWRHFHERSRRQRLAEGRFGRP